MTSENEERVLRLKRKLEKNDLNNRKAYDVIYELKAKTQNVTYEMLQRTGIGKTLNLWIRKNSEGSEIRSVTIKEAQKLIGKWKKAMEEEQARRSQPSDSESDSDSETEDAPIIKAEPQDEEEGEYSPGGGDTAYSAYEPAPTEKPSKPYRPGGFFYDDDDEDEDEEDEDDFLVEDDEVEEEHVAPAYTSAPINDSMEDIDPLDLLAEMKSKESKKAEKKRKHEEDEAEKRRVKRQKLEEKEQKRKEREKQRLIEEENREIERKKAKKEKRKREIEKQLEKERIEKESEKARKKAKEARKAEKLKLEKLKAKQEKLKIKEEPASSPPKQKDVFGLSDSDESEDEFGVNLEPEIPFQSRISHTTKNPSEKKIKKEKKEEDKTLTEILAEKKDKAKKKEKKDKKLKNKTNLNIKKEVDTDKFSFEALMTMNTAKVKKKKKVKEVVNETDSSVLDFQSTTASLPAAKARVEAQSAEMTDRDAAFLATQRKKGGGQMMGAASQRNKVKYVSRVYRLQEMSQKMLTNYPQYLLACMYKFIYAADVLMPAMERLDEKQLNLLEEAQPHLSEDTHKLWESLCMKKFGARSAESIRGSGETWKEGFIRLANEKEARLKNLTKMISKKHKKEEKSTKNTKLAFVNGHVKPPPSIKRKQEKYGTGNDFRNAKYNVNIPGVSIADKGPLQRYSRTSGTVHDRPEQRRVDHTGRSRVNIQSNQVSRRDPKKPAPLMAKALRGVQKFRR